MRNLNALLSVEMLYAWHIYFFLVIVISGQPEPIATQLPQVVDDTCALQKFILRKILTVDPNWAPTGCRRLCDEQFTRLEDSLRRATVTSSIGYTTLHSPSMQATSGNIASTSHSLPIFQTASVDFASSSNSPPVFMLLEDGVLDSCQLTASKEHCVGTTRAVSMMRIPPLEGLPERLRHHICGLQQLHNNSTYTQCACEAVLKLPLVHTIARDFMLPDLPKNEYCKGYNIAKRLLARKLPPLWSCSYQGLKSHGGLDCSAAAVAEEAGEADPCICTGGEAICTRATYQNSPLQVAWPYWPDLDHFL